MSDISIHNLFFEVYGRDFGYLIHLIIIYSVAKMYSIYANKAKRNKRFATIIPAIFMTSIVVIIYNLLPHYKIPFINKLTPSNYLIISALAGFITEELFTNFDPKKILISLFVFIKWLTKKAIEAKLGKQYNTELAQIIEELEKRKERGDKDDGKEYSSEVVQNDAQRKDPIRASKGFRRRRQEKM